MASTTIISALPTPTPSPSANTIEKCFRMNGNNKMNPTSTTTSNGFAKKKFLDRYNKMVMIENENKVPCINGIMDNGTQSSDTLSDDECSTTNCNVIKSVISYKRRLIGPDREVKKHCVDDHDLDELRCSLRENCGKIETDTSSDALNCFVADITTRPLSVSIMQQERENYKSRSGILVRYNYIKSDLKPVDESFKKPSTPTKDERMSLKFNSPVTEDRKEKFFSYLGIVKPELTVSSAEQSDQSNGDETSPPMSPARRSARIICPESLREFEKKEEERKRLAAEQKAARRKERHVTGKRRKRMTETESLLNATFPKTKHPTYSKKRQSSYDLSTKRHSINSSSTSGRSSPLGECEDIKENDELNAINFTSVESSGSTNPTPSIESMVNGTESNSERNFIRYNYIQSPVMCSTKSNLCIRSPNRIILQKELYTSFNYTQQSSTYVAPKRIVSTSLNSSVLTLRNNIHETKCLLTNPFDETVGSNGHLLGLIYKYKVLIAIHDFEISFWEYSTVLTLSTIEKQPKWSLIAKCRRQIRDLEVETPYNNRICLDRFTNRPIYIELRSKQLPSDSSRVCHLASTYVVIYTVQSTTVNQLIFRSIQIGTLYGLVSNIRYVAIANSNCFTVSWFAEKELASETSIIKYSLNRDLDTATEIYEFPKISEQIKQLKILNEKTLVGLGDNYMAFWDLNTGCITHNFRLQIPGDDYLDIGTALDNGLIYTLVVKMEISKDDSTERWISMFLVDMTNGSWRKISSVKVPNEMGRINSTILVDNNILFAKSVSEQLLLVDLFDSPNPLVKIVGSAYKPTRIFLQNDCLISQSDNYLVAKSITSFLLQLLQQH